jgi:hypothetical protein
MACGKTRGVVLLLAGALTSCAFFPPAGRVLYQQGRTVVQLETDPTAGRTSLQEWNSHPATIKPTQLVKILDGVRIKNADGLLGTLLRNSAGESVFKDEELFSLAPILSKGLAQASPSECVAFTFWSALPGRRHAPLSGSISVQGPYLIFRLNEHPVVGWQDPENPPPASLFELDFRQTSYLKPGSEDERKGSYKVRPTVRIEYKRYLAVLDDQGGSASTGRTPSVTAP